MSPTTRARRWAVLLGTVVAGGVAGGLLAVPVPPARAAEPAPAAGSAAGVRPLGAQQVIDSVGVNVHLGFTYTAYADYEQVVRPRLLASGIRHVRDRLDTDPQPTGSGGESDYYRKVRDLGAEGIGFTLISDLALPDVPATDPSRLLDVQVWSGGAVEAVEGVNEPDQRMLPSWTLRTWANQVNLATAVRRVPALAGVDVIAPAVVSPAGASLLGDLGRWADFGNIHNYFGDARPELPAEAGADRADGGERNLTRSLREIGRRVVPGKPVLSTEHGYFTSPVTGEGRADAGVSERAAGLYVPRLLLHQVASGVPRTFLYELLSQADEPDDPEANFGLVRTDGSVTPAYRGVASLLRLFEDESGNVDATAPAPAPGAGRGEPVSWEVGGDTADLAVVPIRVSDDAVYLAVWREVSVWDRQADRDLPRDPRPLEVRVAGHRLDAVVRQSADGTFVRQPAAGPSISVDGSVALLRFER